MLVLVTGISTSGKSTVAKELLRLGYEAHDTEHNKISAWYDKVTGSRDAEFGQVQTRTKSWMDAHEWRISIDWVENIAAKAINKTIFLCGGGANEAEVRNYCQKIFWLKTNEATIRKRVIILRDHTYGTKPHELARIIISNQNKEKEYHQLGATILDATQPLKNVVDKILAKTLL